MSSRETPPYRADHVGSLLRPPELLQAREDFAASKIDADELRGVEDAAIRDAVKLQEDVGLRSATDGEFRRATWHMDFIYALGGIEKTPGQLKVKFHNAEGDIEWTPAATHVGSRITLEKPIFAEHFQFLQECVTSATPKLTIPSPSMVHYRGGRAAVDESVYPDMDQFWADLTNAYADQVQAMADLGCTYLQFDDTSLAYLNDPNQRAEMAAQGRRRRAPARGLHPPHQRGAEPPPRRAWRSRPTCAAGTSGPAGWPRAATTSSPRRCSTSSTWTASSWSGTTRAPAASSRCGSCPRARSSCSASSPPSRATLETKDLLKRRIEEATQYVDLDQLCLSPQCGFSSTVEGNALTVEQEIDKLRLVVETAEEVWG